MAVPTIPNTPPYLQISVAAAGGTSYSPAVDRSPTNRYEGFTLYEASEEYGQDEAVLGVSRRGTVR